MVKVNAEDLNIVDLKLVQFMHKQNDWKKSFRRTGNEFNIDQRAGISLGDN